MLKTGLKFANGHDLTSSDVKFSFDRQLKIADANGPSTLLYNLDSTEATDRHHRRLPPQGGQRPDLPANPVQPSRPDRRRGSLLADKVTTDDDIVKAKAFAGQYTIASYKFNELVQFKAIPGLQGPARHAEDRRRSTSSTSPTSRT